MASWDDEHIPSKNEQDGDEELSITILLQKDEMKR